MSKTLLISFNNLIYVNKEKLREIIINLDPFKQNFLSELFIKKIITI